MVPALVISEAAQIVVKQDEDTRSQVTPRKAILMTAIDQQFGIVIIFFIYGLAFFSMGLVISTLARLSAIRSLTASGLLIVYDIIAL